MTYRNSGPAAHKIGRPIASGAAFAVVVLIGCLVWAHHAVGPVREQHDEYQWLAAHGTHETDEVMELGWQEPDGSARTVIVRTNSGVQAFVHLEGSTHRVTSPGTRIPVVLDQRESPAVGTGAAPDVLDRSFVGDYAGKLTAPAAVAVLALLAASAGLAYRRRRQRVIV